MRSLRWSIGCFLVLAFSLPAPGAAQAPVASPCADSLYQALRGKPLPDLSEREYEYFMQREKACTEYQQLRALIDRPKSEAPRPVEAPLTSETRSQGNSTGGADFFVRNTSDRPIIINSVRVYDCVGLRVGSCGMHYPKMVIQAGQERRILSVRYVEGQRANYRYSYNLSAVTP